ncbi:hypothetical protein GCM10028784_24710 [Myceligenerans cantabricum]
MVEARYRVGLVALLVLAFCASGGVAWAWWTATTTAQAPPMASGSMDLTGGETESEQFLVGAGGTWTHSTLTLSGTFPGESVARAVVLRAAGTADLTVSGTAVAASAGLGPDLLLSVTRDGLPTNTTVDGLRRGTCSGTAVVTRQPVTVTPAPFLTDVTIPADGTLSLCVELGLDGDAPSSVQGQSTSVAFALTARQAGAP